MDDAVAQITEFANGLERATFPIERRLRTRGDPFYLRVDRATEDLALLVKASGSSTLMTKLQYAEYRRDATKSVAHFWHTRCPKYALSGASS